MTTDEMYALIKASREWAARLPKHPDEEAISQQLQDFFSRQDAMLLRAMAENGELEKENKQLSARLDQQMAPRLEKLCDNLTLIEGAKRALDEVERLRARIAELEAPPVVPDGYEVVKADHQVDHDEYEERWELRVRDADGGPITVAHVDAGNVCHGSSFHEPFAALWALMWAAEQDGL